MAVTRYVNPNSATGGDGTTNATSGANRAYASLSEWESARQAVLADVEECICETGGNADATSVMVDGWTTTASFYIDIKTSAGHRHAGVWNTAKYNLNVSGANMTSLTISEDYVRLEGLQIEESHATAARRCVHVTGTGNAASTDIRLDACIVRGGGTESSSFQSVVCESGMTTIRNSAIYGNGLSEGVHGTFGANAATVNCDNVTVARCGTYGFNRAAGTMTLRNCYSGGHGTDAYTGTITRTTCAHSSATSFSNSTASVAHSTANFTNVTAGSEDYRLVTGSALIDVGTDLSGTFTNSINGVTRPSGSAFDIGAAEFAAAAVAPVWFDGLISQPIPHQRTVMIPSF